MSTFDPKRDYGTIHNDSKGRVYVQDGVYYMGDGSEYCEEAPGEEAKPSKQKKSAAPVQAVLKSEAESQLVDQLKG